MASENHDDAYAKSVRYSAFYAGKMETVPKVPVRSLDDFSVWYSPGVAAVSRAIHERADLSFEYTNRWNTVGVITDGSRVLGLGDIGPEAAYPVMEGKALIYKYLGGVDAFALPIRVSNPDEYIRVVRSLEPALGGVNMEDTASPKCFEILERLRNEMTIPVWHDDQQGTAGVILAALYNALELTGRDLKGSRYVLFGSGAANIAAARLLMQAGAEPGNIILVDTKGTLHAEREDMDQLFLKNRWKYDLALETNKDRVKGDLRTALRGADVLIAAAAPGPEMITKEEIRVMKPRPVAFLLSNPVPEMWPEDAIKAGAEIVATGRSDFPNQVNNSIIFPSVLRGALDIRARTITDTMVIAAAKEVAAFAREGGLSKERIIPTMLDWELFPRVAAVVGEKGQQEGVSRRNASRDELYQHAKGMIEHSRNVLQVLLEAKVIRDLPQ
jgi:malate dehydrogenase (oxaloacetate-decarboxylating)